MCLIDGKKSMWYVILSFIASLFQIKNNIEIWVELTYLAT